MPPVYAVFSDMFDPNAMHTSDIVVKHISEKETLFKLDLEHKGQGQSKKQKIITEGTKIFPSKYVGQGLA